MPLSYKLSHKEEANRPKRAIDSFRISCHPGESEEGNFIVKGR